jgi:putative membrane protein
MKKLSLLMMAAVAAFSMEACHSSKDSKSAADSMNNARDTTKMDSAKKDTTVGMTVNGDEAKFAVTAADGGMAEVMLGKLAQEKSNTASIKEFGAMMVTDHSKANDELKALAKSKNIALPLVVSADKQKAYDDLNKKTGADFDKAYVSMMIDGHKSTAKLMQYEANNGKDPDLKAFAAKILPTVNTHLAKIEDIDKMMKK